MNVEKYRAVFLVVTAVVALFVASPALSRLLVYPRTEFFTELWLLGSNHRAESYPYNIARGQNYSVFLGIANHLGHTGYYLVEIKFHNRTQSAPSSFGPLSNRTPSSLPSLYNISAFVSDEESWELPLAFSFNYVNTTLSSVQMNSLRLNNVDLNMSGYGMAWDSQRREFRGNLFFELWLYNRTISVFQYHQRFVSLRLNMTVT
jgi:hypothetical protein